MARGVNDVDLVLAVLHGGVLGGDGDAALTLQIVGVHDAVLRNLVFAVNTGLLEQAVDQGSLTVVNVCDDGYVSQLVILHDCAPLIY